MRRGRLAPLVAESVELVRSVHAWEAAGVAPYHVDVPLEHEATLSGRHHAQYVSGLQPCILERLDWDGGLMLGAEAGKALPPFLYFCHCTVKVAALPTLRQGGRFKAPTRRRRLQARALCARARLRSPTPQQRPHSE